jgi:D-hydroxyproline dehydrogenase subunit beta
MTSNTSFDWVIAGAGIVGLAHALTAIRSGTPGARIAVVDKDHRAVGASIRNFGFITVSGQRAGDTWRRARRSRDVWAEIAPLAGIAIVHRGLWLLGRRALSEPVLQAFCATEMGEQCALVSAAEAGTRAPWLRTDGATCALYSPHELRVESKTALPRLAAWLAEVHGVQFFWGEEVLGVECSGSHASLRTAQRSLNAERLVLCPGTEMNGVAKPFLDAHFEKLSGGNPLHLTRLQMLRVMPDKPLHLGSAVMGDLSLTRYHGYADLPESKPLLAQLQREEAQSLADGIHLIAVQSEDGSLVVGDSHHYAPSPEPFANEAVDNLILRHLHETLNLGPAQVTERWTGVYPTGAATDCLIARPDARLAVVLVTSGTGASTAFGIAEDVLAGANLETSISKSNQGSLGLFGLLARPNQRVVSLQEIDDGIALAVSNKLQRAD